MELVPTNGMNPDITTVVDWLSKTEPIDEVVKSEIGAAVRMAADKV
jgi:hypothetical protein